jgi:hypothetical protein
MYQAARQTSTRNLEVASHSFQREVSAPQSFSRERDRAYPALSVRCRDAGPLAWIASPGGFHGLLGAISMNVIMIRGGGGRPWPGGPSARLMRVGCHVVEDGGADGAADVLASSGRHQRPAATPFDAGKGVQQQAASPGAGMEEVMTCMP